MSSLTQDLLAQKHHPLFAFELNAQNCLVFNLSNTNTNSSFAAIQNVSGLTRYLQESLNKAHKKYGAGGYAENRAIYKRFAHFNNGASAERHYHLGLDVWAPAYTPVYCPLPGKVHSFAFNGNKGDYGGTLILKHRLKSHVFYTLYGHLSLASLTYFKVGQSFNAGQKLAELGDVHENVDWPPHLHFQIIENIGEYRGDYPGVCSAEEKEKMLANCPNPNALLQLDFLF
jgi:murein DD-endopeptidase MepM/ murein hydrolase activator NlpD